MKARIRSAYLIPMVLALALTGCSTLTQIANPEPVPTPTPAPAPFSAPGSTPGATAGGVPGSAGAPLGGTTYTVKKGNISQSLSAPVRVVAARDAALYFKISGQMGELAVKIGDQVRQGSAIASLSGRSLEQQLAQAQLDLDTSALRLARVKADSGSSAADLSSAQATVDQSEIALQSARLKLSKLLSGPSKDEIIVAKGAMEKAEAKVKKAQSDYDKVYWHTDVGTTAQAAALEEANTDYQVALAAYNVKMAGPSSDDLSLAQNDVKAAEISLAKARADLAQRAEPNPLRSFDIQLAEKEVQRARMNLDQVRNQASDSTIIAPFTGNVANIMVRPGESVSAFSPVIRLADPGSLEVRADMDDASLPRLVVGQKVTVAFGQTGSQQLPATVAQLPTAASAVPGGGDRSVLLKLDAATTLAPGMQGSVSLTLQEKDSVLLIPKDALRTSGGRTYVMVQKADAPQQIDVRTGIQSADMVEILSGLQEGDQVVGR